MTPTDIRPPASEGKKKKTWPSFNLWVQEGLQASEQSPLSKPFDLAGGLYLVSTPIGNLGDITLRALLVLHNAHAILCEDTRVTGGLLHQYGIKRPLISCHDHNEAQREKDVLGRLERGEALALVSDAGTPLISDPGFRLVRACRAAGYPVIPVPGASALLSALCCAGIPTDRFLFAGFLPAKELARKQALQELSHMNTTLVFYESPHRLAATITSMANIWGPDRQVGIGRELTKLYESMEVLPLKTWQERLAARDQSLKGEIVVIVEPSTSAPPAQEADIDLALSQALEKMSLKDAVALVSHQSHIKKSIVYQRALFLSATD